MARNPMDKVLRPFALKAVQVILQSRLNERISTPCIPDRSSPYGLNIEDLPEVHKLTKAVLADRFDECICVEVSLKFNDDEDFTLESWCIETEPEEEPEMKTIQQIDTEMSSMLKSLMVITRLLPAHKMTKGLDRDSYSIHYSIRLGDPNAVDLGNAYETMRFNRYPSGYGIIQMGVAYRTKIVKTWTGSGPVSRRTSKAVDLNETMKYPAFVNEDHIPYTDEKLESKYHDLDKLHDFIAPRTPTELKVAKESQPQLWEAKMKPIIREEIKTEDRLFKKELTFAFASPTPLGELATFYRTFTDAPELEEFRDLPAEEDVSVQLKKYENDLTDYDRLISEL